MLEAAPFIMKWAANKNRMVVGSICPHCGARIGPNVPVGRLMLILAIGGVVVIVAGGYFLLSHTAVFALWFAWMACTLVWRWKRPLIVLPEDYNPYDL